MSYPFVFLFLFLRRSRDSSGAWIGHAEVFICLLSGDADDLSAAAAFDLDFALDEQSFEQELAALAPVLFIIHIHMLWCLEHSSHYM